MYHSKIELKSWLKDTGAFFEGVKKKIYDDEGKEFGKGVLKPNECMNGVFETELDSEQRYHEGSVKASARLSPHKQNTPSVQCEAEANLLARFEYSDDCRVKVMFDNSFLFITFLRFAAHSHRLDRLQRGVSY